MEILKYVLIGLQIVFYLICCFMGGWLTADMITKKKDEKKKIESSIIKQDNIIIAHPKRQMFVEIVFGEEEFQFFDGFDGSHHCFYLPGTDLKVGQFVTFTFTPGHIYYEIDYESE